MGENRSNAARGAPEVVESVVRTPAASVTS
jgi:hypothetical protein